MKNLLKLIVLFGIVGILLIPIRTQAVETLTFFNISGNNATNATNGEDQARVDVTDVGGGKVAFKFYLVEGSDAVFDTMSITQVHYDDGELFGISSITNSIGVSYSNPADQTNLPSWNDADPDFYTTVGFSADADSPPYHNGVNNLGEFVTITFDLNTGKTYQDILDNLSNDFDNDGALDLRIGIHVQGYANGGSESFVNNPPGNGPGTPVPEPGSLCLSLGALFLLFGIGAKRKREV